MNTLADRRFRHMLGLSVLLHGALLLALPEGEGAAKALDYIKNYPGITYEEVGSNG